MSKSRPPFAGIVTAKSVEPGNLATPGVPLLTIEQDGAYLIPPGCSQPLVKPRSIDDVPILALTLSSRRYGDFELRRIAAQLDDAIKQVPDVSVVSLIGGQRREVRIVLDESKLAAYNLSPLQVAGALGMSNRRLPSGQFSSGNVAYVLETGECLRTADDVRSVVVAVANDKPVFVRNVAEVSDGGEEPTEYVRTADAATRQFLPAVTLAISKRKGTNAVLVAGNVLRRIEPLKGSVIPSDVKVGITRNYGETAAEKSNELLFHMLIAVVSVSVLIAITLGFRESLIVFIAIPVTLALTLAVFYLYGYTLNRITLFALIFSMGILVDDAIVVVENIVCHWRMPANRERPSFDVAIEAVDEVGNPTILATLTVVAAILPMAFVGGLMGPYMRPIPIGASAAIVFSLLVAFVVTPWAAVRILKPSHSSDHGEREDMVTRWYRRFMGAILHKPALRWGFLGGIAFLLLGSMSLVYFQVVKVKMLPFDNKSEFQVIVNMPNGTTLEETARVADALARAALDQPEVVDLQTYAGTASPYNFNGLVRHYYLRRGANVADLQINLLPKDQRKLQSHEIAKRVRQRLVPVANRYGARIQVAEVPPGPPVLETLVAEVYGPAQTERIAIARRIRDLWKRTHGVVDVDWYVEDDQPKYRILADREKAALNGISEEDIARTMQLASAGYEAGLLHVDSEKEDVPLNVRLSRASRSDLERIEDLKVAGRNGRLVALRELVRVEPAMVDTSIYHKNLMPVTYVTADIAGAMESPVYAVLKLGPEMDKFKGARGICHRATHGRPAIGCRALFHEVGRRVAHHLRSLPRPGNRFRRRADSDLRTGGGVVSVFCDTARDHGRHPVLAGRHPAGARADARFLHRHVHDRLHRRSGYRGAEIDHPGGFCRAAAGRGHGARCRRDRCRRGPLPSHDADRRGRGGGVRRNSLRPHISRTGNCADGR